MPGFFFFGFNNIVAIHLNDEYAGGTRKGPSRPHHSIANATWFSLAQLPSVLAGSPIKVAMRSASNGMAPAPARSMCL